MKITMEGKYMTREGDAVEILRDNVRNEDFPIVGIITFPNGSQEQNRWMADGKYDGSEGHDLDLFALPTKQETWGVVALNPIEAFTEKMSEEVAENSIDFSDAGMVSLLAQALNGASRATERLAGACYLYSLHRPDVSYGAWPMHDRTDN